ncbi:ETS homologous factor-like [Liolophura sinensis]|uniref:ETS homologous factor-like n=1 Tax=Liolophura sinensis TaxID=3198878 RepID=UPI00315923B3
MINEDHVLQKRTNNGKMNCIPSPVQSLEEPMFALSDELSMYDPCMMIKPEPDKDFGSLSCSDLMASPLPSFDQIFNHCTYSPAVDHSGLHSWTAQHPEHWSSPDVLNWVYFVAEKHNLDTSQIRGEHFQNITGQQLCRMQREDFERRDPVYGAYLFGILQNLLKEAKFSEPKCDRSVTPDNFPMLASAPYAEDKLTDISNSTCTEDGIKVLIGGDIYDIDLKLPIEIPGVESNIEPVDNGYFSESDSYSEHNVDSMEMDAWPRDLYPQSCLPTKYRCHTNSLSSICSDVSEDSEVAYPTPPKKQNNRGRPAGQASKGNHLWEFIRDTLKDPKFNPTLIKWEDKKEGVFRFVQSEAVAQMWGRKKNNKCMTYEKLSRAMRFCRTTGFFASLPKTGKYPKKLCFKFGSKASGWQD